ncbi:hypothetical protein IFM89_024245 [Coptis chinensis]|uniref:Uncharacterized protein n=1 Tax=Coptis chinensis TaxID=261450 RepID=A0A835LWF5_9MAGN|nr:hypothetical protein IFM89_024245 [Coptis chinensis]
MEYRVDSKLQMYVFVTRPGFLSAVNATGKVLGYRTDILMHETCEVLLAGPCIIASCIKNIVDCDNNCLQKMACTWCSVRETKLTTFSTKTPVHWKSSPARHSSLSISSRPLETVWSINTIALGTDTNSCSSSAEMAREVMKTQDIAFASRTSTTAAKLILYGCTDMAI